MDRPTYRVIETTYPLSLDPIRDMESELNNLAVEGYHVVTSTRLRSTTPSGEMEDGVDVLVLRRRET